MKKNKGGKYTAFSLHSNLMEHISKIERSISPHPKQLYCVYCLRYTDVWDEEKFQSHVAMKLEFVFFVLYLFQFLSVLPILISYNKYLVLTWFQIYARKKNYDAAIKNSQRKHGAIRGSIFHSKTKQLTVSYERNRCTPTKKEIFDYIYMYSDKVVLRYVVVNIIER